MKSEIIVVLILFGLIVVAYIPYIRKFINTLGKPRKGLIPVLPKPKVWMHHCSGDMVPTSVEREYGKFFARVAAGYVSQRLELRPHGEVSQGNMFQCARGWEPIDREGELEQLYQGNLLEVNDD